ncbi:MAG TPA: ABC transporter permease, partial [Paenirhodobacter sp.]
MTDASASLITGDGKPLKAALAASLAVRRRRALLLVAPLFLFIFITFIVPIGQMLFQSVHNDAFSANAPALGQWFKDHPQGADLDESAYAALASDLVTMQKDKTSGVVGTRINYDVPGTRSLFTAAARGAPKLQPPFKEALLAQDQKWADPNVWRAMRSASSAFTGDFFLNAVDMTRDQDGKIVSVPADQSVYKGLFWRTIVMSLEITVLCLLLGFPIAFLLASVKMKHAMLLMILVLLPFWTSLLVRTTSWMVLLQQQGVVNDILVWLGLIRNDQRLEMMYNQTGTIVAMTHILLPFTILPLYSVMKTIPPTYVRAARSLGATSWTAFRRVYMPQTLPGIGAGGLLVFILAMGYYITPALVGGADGQMI